MSWEIGIIVRVALMYIVINCVHGKVYERCELARELRDVHEIPDNQLAAWVCIARHESEYNTSAINPGSGDHGLLQISQLFWCSPPGYACGVSCEDLRNDDIEDDVICARRVFREHKRISGDGFNAWVVYGLYCRDKQYAKSFIEGCFAPGELKTSEDLSVEEKPLPTVDYYPQFRKKTTMVTTTKKPSTTSTTTPKPTKPTVTTKVVQTKTSTRKPPTTTTRKVTRKVTKPVQTTEKIVTSTVKKLAKKPGDSIKDEGKLLHSTEENDEFTYSISKTGYKFTRL